MNESNQTATKSYSFLNIKQCIGKDNKPYHGVTVSGIVVNPSGLQKTANGREYCRFSMPIQNQGPRIWKACDIAPQADENGTVWANVSFWGNNASRFLKYLERHKHPVIIVTGSIRVEQSTSSDGKVYINTSIAGDDFMHVRDLRAPSHGAANAPDAKAEQAGHKAAAATTRPDPSPESTLIPPDANPGDIPLDELSLKAEDLPF